ncbi:cell wall-binding repeat-containing protein [Clostridium botulinum]|uniref:Cell wall-binding repeat-containing protein n=2 Tax=Clostridium TaxID=1485 RepID=A0A6M0T2A7_CLOBO|nr:cell wall-binding repeat-containing protein [Clostridium botulinum]NFI75390.1 hypothetical protein [Clostridium sporogenes]NFL73265.1 hypothetical protein [Clostridium sporogenes]NFM25678.1 hypothetical protein [Clostridium sporogenes]NFP63324.1 hypothetical protein [Clostridium sporogenes]
MHKKHLNYMKVLLIKEYIDTIILASGENYADALRAVPLASKNQCPILLAESNSINSFTINEIKRLNPNKIIVIGGEEAISQKVCNDIKKTNQSIVFERIGGKDRYETNTKVLNRFIDELDLSKVYMAIGDPSNMDYADALSCAPLAAISKSPILLVPTTRQIPKSITDFAYDKLQNNTNIIAIGGKAILPNYKINSIIPEK